MSDMSDIHHFSGDAGDIDECPPGMEPHVILGGPYDGLCLYIPPMKEGSLVSFPTSSLDQICGNHPAPKKNRTCFKKNGRNLEHL
jgi:hypothetical protein